MVKIYTQPTITDASNDGPTMEAQIRNNIQVLSCRVEINGIVKSVTGIEYEADFDQLCSTCTLEMFDPENIQPNDFVEVWQGYNNVIYKTFSGYVDIVDVSEYPDRVVVRCRDVLKRAVDNYMVSDSGQVDEPYHNFNRNPEGGFITIQAEDAVDWLLDDSKAYYINGTDTVSYYLDTSSYTIGQSDYEWKVNLISAADAIQEVSKLMRYHIWAYRREIYWQHRLPVPNIALLTWTFSDDQSTGDILKAQVSTTDERLRNKVVVFGYNDLKAIKTPEIIGDQEILTFPNPHVPPSYYRTTVLASDLYDTQGVCDSIAQETLIDLSRLTSYLTINSIGNPMVRVGDTVRVMLTDYTGALWGTDAYYFVYSARSRMQAEPPVYTSEFVLIRGRDEDGWVPGEAGDLGTLDWTPTLIRWWDTDLSQNVWAVNMDAASQDSNFHGDISKMDISVTWENWECGYTGPYQRQVYQNYIYNDVDIANLIVTATVRDTYGNTTSHFESISNVFGTPVITEYVRSIWLAAGDVYHSINGGESWSVIYASVDVVCVITAYPADPSIAYIGTRNATGICRVGYVSEGIISYRDLPDNTGQEITAIYSCPDNSSIIYAAEWVYSSNDQCLWKSIDNSLTWTKVYTFNGGRIRKILTFPNSNIVYVAQGNCIYLSINGGTTFTTFADFGTIVYDFDFSDTTQYIGVATSNGPYISCDSGATWYSSDTVIDAVNIAMSKNRHGVAVAQDSNGTLYKHSSQGTWTASSNPPGDYTEGMKVEYDPDIEGWTYVLSTISPLGYYVFEISPWDGDSVRRFVSGVLMIHDFAIGPLTDIFV